ncbi:MAG: glycosyltransferase family 9 protein [Candidatus Berkelbacteria bacterium]|nr:glycosyltransferase family 9 protein [Candidatus Berkelbacteria bacterium]
MKQLISASGGHGDWLSIEIVASDLTFQHEAERQLELAVALAGRKLGPYPVKIELSDADRQNASLLLKEVGQNKGPVVAMHPGANVDFKTWPLDRFIEVGRYLTQERKAIIAVLGTNGQETEMANKLSNAVGPMAVNLTGKTPVRTLTAFLELCGMYIGNDSGPMHLAAAAGCPTVAIFGATNPDRFGPYLPDDFMRVVVSKDFNHSMVGKAREIGKKILDTISVEMVTEAVDDLWNIAVDRFESRPDEKNDL